MSTGFLVAVLLLGTLGTAVLGLLSKWIDRKVTARVQWRVGPPLLQPVYDLLKLLGKETLISEGVSGRGFLAAPLFGLAAVIAAACIIWGVILDPTQAFVGDLIVVVYLLTIPSLAFIVGGSSSASVHGGVGASREMKLLLSYELPFILALVTVLVAVAQGRASAEIPWRATFSLGAIVQYQAEQGAMVNIFRSPFLVHLACLGGLVIALLSVQAKLGAVPFDIAEAETEIMSGLFVEYSGPPLAVIYLTRAMLLATLPLLLALTFVGRHAVWTPVAYVIFLVLYVLIRNTNPRVRIDQAMRFFWYRLAPLGVICLLLALSVK